MAEAESGGGGGKEQGTMVAARIESYVPEYILYHDPVRFGSEHFFGVPVKLTYSADHRGVKLESKLPSQKAMRKFAKRKNKNPLKTRITVKELKKIVEHHKQSMQANRPITPGLPAPNDILHRAMTVVNISATDVFSSHEPHLEEYSTGDGALLAMPMTFRPRKDLIGYPTSMDGIAFAEKRSIKRKYAVKFRPKSFDMARLTIGNFVARQLADAQKQNEVKVYFAKQLICYELTIDYPSKTCARPNRYSIVLSFNFEDIIGMHFTDHEVYIRLRCPPMQVFCSVQRTGDGDVGGLFPEDTSDMTFGERNTSLVHKIELAHKQGALWQHWLLDYDVRHFEPLMMTRLALMNFATVDRHQDADMPVLAPEEQTTTVPLLQQSDVLFIELPDGRASGTLQTPKTLNHEEANEVEEGGVEANGEVDEGEQGDIEQHQYGRETMKRDESEPQYGQPSLEQQSGFNDRVVVQNVEEPFMPHLEQHFLQQPIDSLPIDDAASFDYLAHHDFIDSHSLDFFDNPYSAVPSLYNGYGTHVDPDQFSSSHHYSLYRQLEAEDEFEMDDEF